MAKKTKKKFKDTKVGKLIGKIGKLVGGKNQTGSLLGGLGVNTLKNETPLAPRTQTQINNSSTRDLKGNKLVYGDPNAGNLQSSSNALAPGQAGGIIPSPGLNPKTGISTPEYIAPPKKTGTGGGTTIIPKADAPGVATDVNTLSSLNLSGGNQSLGLSGGGTSSPIMGAGTSVAGANSALTGLDTANSQIIKTAEQTALDAQKALVDKDQKKNTSFLSKLFKEQDNAPTIAEQRADLSEQYGIQAKTSEINSLTENLVKMETEVANQIAMANDKLGSNNFINNQIQQIERNASPALNRLRADINFKTGILTQNEALIEQAIQDATAESKDKWNRALQIYNINQDIIDGLKGDYKDAYKDYIRRTETEHDDNVRETEWKRDMIIEYGLKNSINDSVEVITKAASRAQGVKNASSGNSGSTGFSSSKVESSLREDAVALLDEVALGNLTVDKAYSKLRTLYSPKEATDDAIKSLLGLTTQNSSSQSIYGSNPVSFKGTESGLDTTGISADIYNLLFK